MDQHHLYDDRSYWKISTSLIRNGFEVYTVAIGDEDDEGVTNEGVNYKLIKRKKFAPTVYLNYLFKKIVPVKDEYDEAFEYCKKIQADIYQVEDLRINRIIGKLKNLPNHPKLVYDIREPRDNNLKDIKLKKTKIPKSLTGFYADYIQNWEYKISEKYYDFILAVDDGIYHRIKKNVPNAKVDLIYNFTNLSETRQNIPKNEKKYDAAYVGGMSEIRGILTVVYATKLIAKKYPNYKLLLLGKIYDENLKTKIDDFIQENHLNENIILLDFVPYEEVSDYYNQIKIGLNPLWYSKAHLEIIQIKLFEYMNYGIPIITSNFGYMQKYVEENEVGITVPPGDEKSLANAVLRILNDDDLYQKFHKNGIRAVDQKYNWQMMETKLLKIYNSLLDGSPKK